MDRANLEKQLREVEGLLAHDGRSIANQHEVITTLERGGHDANFARMFLRRLELQQSKHQAARGRLLKDLAD
jgi:inactivated superfamily I helicase